MPAQSTAPRRAPFACVISLGALCCVLQSPAAAQSANPAATSPATQTETPASAPASTPAGTLTPLPRNAKPTTPHATVSAKQAREADDAYLDGAKALQRGDLITAERHFTRALSLNPTKSEYVLSLSVVREQRLTALVQQAARARQAGDTARADALLNEARALDPENSVITQHFGPGANATPLPGSSQIPIDFSALPGGGIAPELAGAPQLAPRPGVQSFHRRANAQDLLRLVYSAYGINVTFDDSVTADKSIKLDLEDVDFATASRLVRTMTHTFAVPVQPNAVLLAKDNAENRERLLPLVEETIYLPGLTAEQMTELANLARNVFELRTVTASASAGDIVVRGDEPTLRLLNATYADMLDGGSDVLLELHMYEIDRTHQVNIGAQLPTSVGVFSVLQEAQQLVNANQTLINTLLSSGTITLTSNPTYNILLEALALIKYGGVTDANLSSLLGFIGTLNGVPLLGVTLTGTSTFNLLLNSSDVRTLDVVQVRAGDGQAANFRLGTRYPVVTSTYSSGVSSSVLSSLAGVTVNGQSASSLLSQYLGTSSVSVPQFQFEDLGFTLKATPHILRHGQVNLALDMKIEALAGGSINSVPILNNRTLTSTVTIASGQTALLISHISRNELSSIEGIPYLSELPGFQGTNRDTEKDSTELLMTLTPHIIREPRMHIASRRLSVELRPGASNQ